MVTNSSEKSAASIFRVEMKMDLAKMSVTISTSTVYFIQTCNLRLSHLRTPVFISDFWVTTPCSLKVSTNVSEGLTDSVFKVEDWGSAFPQLLIPSYLTKRCQLGRPQNFSGLISIRTQTAMVAEPPLTPYSHTHSLLSFSKTCDSWFFVLAYLIFCSSVV
jgi:hypothetical protein